MKKEDIDFNKFAKDPGVYIFRGSRKKILYIGRATTLRDRIKSYFTKDLVKTRGNVLVKAVEETKTIETITTDSVLDAIILEAHLIKKYDPIYNTRDKDDKSFQFIAITKEKFGRVLLIRGRDIDSKIDSKDIKYLFGPFPKGGLLKDAMKIIRKIFPYRDRCTPQEERDNGRPCFHRQIKLCPGVCTGEVNRREYSRRIRELVLFLSGEKVKVIQSLEKDMKIAAKKENFELATYIRNRIGALKHIQDAHLIRSDYTSELKKSFRIESYDIAHTSGEDAIGVFVVVEDGELNPSQYRVFKIRNKNKSSDTHALAEVISRRFNHPEWKFPNMIVVDGGKTQLSAVKKELEKYGVKIPVVSVVKNERHKPKDILGDKIYIHTKESEILLSNNEAHRFAVSKHRKQRAKSMMSKKL